MPIKAVIYSVAGVAGTAGALSPLIHIGATSGSWETKWYKRADFSEPILKNCKPGENNSTEINYRNKLYSVFLELINSQDKSKTDNSEIILRVEEVTLTTGRKETKVVWRNQEKKENNWETWKLQHKDSKLDFSYPYLNKWNNRVEYGSTSCEKTSLEPASDTSFGSGVPVTSDEIKLSVSKGDQCRKYFGSVECDVNIDTQGKLKWKDGSQPKVTYKAF